MADVPFRSYERLERCKRVQVTEENIVDIAKALGFSVAFREDKPYLITQAATRVNLGQWIDQFGKAHADPRTQGWWPTGTFVREE